MSPLQPAANEYQSRFGARLACKWVVAVFCAKISPADIDDSYLGILGARDCRGLVEIGGAEEEDRQIDKLKNGHLEE